MSSYPPQPGQPYQPGGVPGYQQPPPQKDNTVWWIVGGIAILLVLCCCGAIAFVGYVGNEGRKAVTSATSSWSTSGAAGASSATSVSEGGSVTLDDALVQSGWYVDSTTGKVNGMRVTNNASIAESFYIRVYYMRNGSYVTDVSCTTGLVQPGTSASATCLTPFQDVDNTQIRMSEGI